MDAYAQRAGSFSEDQEQRLVELRERSKPLLENRPDEREAVAMR